jgi:hypothetical protein
MWNAVIWCIKGVTASLLCDAKECGMDGGWLPAAMSKNLIGSLEKAVIGSSMCWMILQFQWC